MTVVTIIRLIDPYKSTLEQISNLCITDVSDSPGGARRPFRGRGDHRILMLVPDCGGRIAFDRFE